MLIWVPPGLEAKNYSAFTTLQFGEVIATAGHEEATVVGEIDHSMIQTIRDNLPLEMQRREDLYSTHWLMSGENLQATRHAPLDQMHNCNEVKMALQPWK
jgi:hypothetical protein